MASGGKSSAACPPTAMPKVSFGSGRLDEARACLRMLAAHARHVEPEANVAVRTQDWTKIHAKPRKTPNIGQTHRLCVRP